MGQNDIYFQAAIGVLRDDPGETKLQTRNLVSRIVNYAVCRYAASLAKKSDRGAPIDPAAVISAAQQLGIGKLDPEKALEFYNRIGNAGTQFRIRADYVASALADDWPPLKLRALCGVLAGIGDREAARVSTSMIRSLGAGYPSPRGVPEDQLLSEGGTLYQVDQLWFKSFFQMCKFGKFRWYSVRCPNDRYLVKVVKRLVAKPSKKKLLDAGDD